MSSSLSLAPEEIGCDDDYEDDGLPPKLPLPVPPGPRHANLIHVWHENQRVPATLYGDAHFGVGQYEIVVSADAAAARDRQGGVVYNFSSSGGCASR